MRYLFCLRVLFSDTNILFNHVFVGDTFTRTTHERESRYLVKECVYTVECCRLCDGPKSVLSSIVAGSTDGQIVRGADAVCRRFANYDARREKFVDHFSAGLARTRPTYYSRQTNVISRPGAIGDSSRNRRRGGGGEDRNALLTRSRLVRA